MPQPKTSLPPHMMSSVASCSAMSSGLWSGNNTSPQTWRHHGRLRQKRDLLQRLQRMSAVMRALDDRIEAELLGARDEIEIVGEAFPHVMALRVLPAHDQAEFHWLFSLMAPGDHYRYPRERGR